MAGEGAVAAVNPMQAAWRATTAVRVFGLALAAGVSLSTPPVSASLPLLAALAMMAGVAVALEFGASTTLVPAITAGEAVMAAILLGLAQAPAGTVVYLGVPAIVAGVRHGYVAAINVSLVCTVGTVATLMAITTPDLRLRLSSAALWILLGLGMGLLAGWQSRSLRTLAARQAPYAAAHDLMSQLHNMTAQGSLGLDATALADELQGSLRELTGATRSAVFVRSASDEWTLLSSHRATAALKQRHLDEDPTVMRISLRGTHTRVGEVLLGREDPWTSGMRAVALAVADDYALRLDTAALFEEVRDLTRAEERNRIARDMHDGVAQEIVALGYVVDEIESSGDLADTRELAATLRHEISRIVSEIRFSIFELRHHSHTGPLSAILSDYLRAVSGVSDLQVHLVVEESGSALAQHIQAEILRIAQEAITNVRKHARAQNLWVAWSTDGDHYRLMVEDDGIGNAEPRANHWGLQTMHERASGIGAHVRVQDRPGGGTMVSLMTVERDQARQGDTP